MNASIIDPSCIRRRRRRRRYNCHFHIDTDVATATSDFTANAAATAIAIANTTTTANATSTAIHCHNHSICGHDHCQVMPLPFPLIRHITSELNLDENVKSKKELWNNAARPRPLRVTSMSYLRSRPIGYIYFFHFIFLIYNENRTQQYNIKN